MIRILIWAFLIYIAYRIVVKLVIGKSKESANSSGTGSASAYQDPICGVYVSEDDAVIGRHDGQRYYFCSRECLDKFQEKLENK